MGPANLRRNLLSSIFMSAALGVAGQSAQGQTRQELTLPEQPQQAPSVDVRVQQNLASRANCPFEGQGLTTELSGISFLTTSGAQIPPELASALSEVFAPTGTQPLSIVCDIRDAANEALRDDGWIATVQIPQQELKDTLRLDVISARISEVRIIGDAGPYRGLIERQLADLQQFDPLNEKDAERILYTINDVPGMSLRLALAPAGGRPGEVIGNLTVSYQPYTAYFNARNFNSPRIGRETGYGRFEYYGLTGLADVTYAGIQSTLDFQEQVIGQVGHEFGVTKRNIRLGTDLTYARSKPDVEGLDLETDAFLANLRVKYPILRTPRRLADVTLGFDFVDQTTDVGSFPLSKDAIRSLYLRGDVAGTYKGLGATTGISYDGFLELRQGLDIFGATQISDTGIARTDGISASRPFGKADSFVARGGLDVGLSLGSIFGARARGEAQWTDNALLNYDEYSIGNLSIGRGYDPGANSGDRAFGAALEVNANVIRGTRPNVQAFGFYDFVQVENLDFGTPDPKRTLASMGGGLRIGLGDGVRAEVIYAKPLDFALFSDTEKPSDRVMFSLTTKFPATYR